MPRPPKGEKRKEPLEYPVNQLFHRVGVAVNTWLLVLELQRTPEARTVKEMELAARFGLEAAVADRLISRYRFRWDDRGALETIELTPHPAQRRVPGLASLKELYWGGKL